MTDSNQTLSVDFPDLGGGLGGAFRGILQKWLQKSVDGMLPATLIAADDKREYATVQPQIMVLGTDKSTTSRGQIAKVPIFTIGGGGFLLSWPIKPGDLGWIIASDRDISLYLQGGSKEAPPNTNRLHSFNDGLWLPDAARQWALDDEDKDNAVFQSYNGKTKVTLGADKIRMVHPTLVEVSAPSVTMPDGTLGVGKGIGFFGEDPPTDQPSITGELSAVADSHAKDVLTSIIAVLSGNGEATDDTT